MPTYDAVEKSAYDGQLDEYYKFVVGTTTYRFKRGVLNETLSTGVSAIDGTYTAVPITMSEPEHTKDSQSSNITISVDKDNAVAQLFGSTPPDVAVTVFVYRKHATSTDARIFWQGTVLAGKVRESGEVDLVCEPLLARLQRRGLWWRHQPTCNLTLYSPRCGVAVASFSHTATVSVIDGDTITVTGLPALAADYFVTGWMQAPDGSRRFIKAQSGSTFTILLAFDVLSVGNTVTLVAGCKRDYTTCDTKFSNVDRFLGFFRTPLRNPFTQGGLTHNQSGQGE